MTQPAITVIRNSHRFLRYTASVVLVAFTCFVLEPTVLAIRTAEAATLDPVETDEAKLSKAIQKAEHHVALMDDKLAKGLDVAAERQAVIAVRAEITSFDETVMANFNTVKDYLIQNGLPDIIKQRHDATVAEYQAELAALLQHLDNIETATTVEERKAKVKLAKDITAKIRHKRAHQPFNPQLLPHARGKVDPNNKPKVSVDEFKTAGLFNTPFVKLAALGDFTFDKLPGASDPAYLASTPEVSLSAQIQAKAAELGHDSVKIYHWVRNNIQWTPTWGALQNADLTLASGKGNAFDISSLLIALLRASGIPARYVHGTIDVPSDKFRNWVGGFNATNEAGNFAASGGIPVTSLVSGGQIIENRMEHIWVEAAIDYQPSKGAKNVDADSWVPLDASYKQYEILEGVDAVAISGLDLNAVGQSFADSGTTNDAEGWISGFDENVILNAYAQADNAITDYINANNLSDVVDGIGGTKTIIKEHPVLPSSLPNNVVVVGARYGQLPNNLRHTVRLDIYNTVLDRSLESPSLSRTFSIPEISQKRLAITYRPSSSSDEALIADQVASGSTELPIYLVSMTPVIKLDDVDIVSGSSLRMGEDQYIDIVLSSPLGTHRVSYNQIVGDDMVVGLNASGVSTDQITQRRSDYIEDNSLENLHLIALSYWSQADLFSESAAKVFGVKAMRLPSVGLYSSPLSVAYNFGIPYKGNYLKRNIDIKRSIQAAAGSNAENQKQFFEFSGVIQSYLEGSILEQVIRNWQGTGLSAAQVMLDANKQGIKIYTINSNNASQIIPNLQISSAALSDINSAIQSGLEVIVPERAPVKAIGSNGEGYILKNPITGEGAYRIVGGLDGGENEGPCAEPEVRPLVQAIVEIVLTAIVLAILAALIAGAIIGTAGTAGPALASVMATVGLSALTFNATAGGFCTPINVGYHRGGNATHDYCADNYPPNQFFGSDVCVSDGTNQKYFDAISGGLSILWEMKTDNFDNQNAFVRGQTIASYIEDASDESGIARNCNFQYRFLVGDGRFVDLLLQTRPDFVPTLADQLITGPAYCISP